MTQEEKAQAYDGALSVAQETYTTQPMYREWLAKMFPELKESEGEKTKKEILDYIIKGSESYYDVQQYGKETFKKWIAWLEKQGEKGTNGNEREIPNFAWNEDDEVGLGDAMWAIEQARTIAKDENDMGNLWYAERWLKSLKDRVQPQNRWKESPATADLENSLCDIQDGFSDTSYEYRILGEAIEFIRCTESKPRWKPSDEQLEALANALSLANNCGEESAFDLRTLHKQLKKLKG